MAFDVVTYILCKKYTDGQIVQADVDGKIADAIEALNLDGKLSDMTDYVDLKVLNLSNDVDAKFAALPNGLVYRGAKSYYADLPANAQIGDLYTIVYKGESPSTELWGAEFAWGTYEEVNQWIKIGPEEIIYTGSDTIEITDDAAIKVKDNIFQPVGNYVTTDTEQTITGNKTFSGYTTYTNALAIQGDGHIKSTVDTGAIRVLGATTQQHGASFVLHGRGYPESEWRGTFAINAQTSSSNDNCYTLKGTPTGALTWGTSTNPKAIATTDQIQVYTGDNTTIEVTNNVISAKDDVFAAKVHDHDAVYVKLEDGKGLSSNDYTTEEKTKLAGLYNYTVTLDL